MDGCALQSLSLHLPSWDQVKIALSVLGSVVITASMITSLTPTPAPGTKWAKVYKYIEYAALLFSHAKDQGYIPQSPKVDKALEDAINLARKAQTRDDRAHSSGDASRPGLLAQRVREP